MLRCNQVRSARVGAQTTAHSHSHSHSHSQTDGKQSSVSIAHAAAVGTITLDETGRHRRRLMMRSDQGIDFLLDLPEVTLLRSGDRLLLDDGREIEVRSAAESLYEVRGKDPLHLLQLTWHMGNRHLPTEIRSDHVRIREDGVIRTMLEELGGTVTPISEAFEPEGGAYGHG